MKYIIALIVVFSIISFASNLTDKVETTQNARAQQIEKALDNI